MNIERVFAIGSVRIEPTLNRIGGHTVEPRVMEVLVYLAEHAGSVVSRDALLDALWNGTAVGDEALTRTISKLRKAFDDDRTSPKVIETVSKRGYRLVAPVVFESTRTLGPSLVIGAVAALVIAAAVYAGRISTPGNVASPPAPIISRPLTSFPGREIYPALSPDGKFVAFAWQGESGDNWDIYVKPTRPSPRLRRASPDSLVRLTASPAAETRAAWSPDGARMAFIRNHGGACDVVTTQLSGGAEESVADCTGGGPAIAWSPDGDSLVYARGTSLYRLSLDARDEETLTSPPHGSSDHDPAFSADGSSIAFVRSAAFDVQDIYWIDSRGGAAKRITRDARMVRGLTWSSDDQNIIYASHRRGPFHLWSAGLGGAEPQWVPIADGKFLLAPSTSPGSSKLVYETWTYDVNIWRAPLGDDSEPVRVIASTQWDGAPRISPDGEAIAFTSLRSGNMELWLAGSDGAQPRAITRMDGPMLHGPRWSPDGEQLVFVARLETHADVFVVDRAGETTRRLTSAPWEELAPSWSHDGRHVYFASDRGGSWEIWRAPVHDGAAAQQITARGGFDARETSDGAKIVYTKRGEEGLFETPLDGGSERRIAPLAVSTRWELSAHDTVFFRDGASLVRLEPSTGETETVARVDGALPMEGFSMAADGTSVMFARMDHSASDLMLVDSLESR